MSKLKAAETMVEGSCLCPECGWTGGEASRRGIWHWSRSGPIVIAIVVLVALVTWVMLTAKSNGVSTGNSAPIFVEPGFSKSQLKAIADGASPGNDLAQDVLGTALATTYWSGVERYGVAVGFLKTKGERSTSIRRGWPLTWMSMSTSDSYDDMLRRTGRKESVTDPAAAPVGRWAMPSNPLLLPVRPIFQWNGFIVSYNPPPEKTGGRRVSGRIYPALLLIPVAVCVMLWYALAAGAGLCGLLRIKAPRLRSKKVRIVIVAALGVLLFSLSVFYTESSESRPWTFNYTSKVIRTPSGFQYGVREEFRRLDMSLAEFEKLVVKPDADKVVAGLILEALSQVPAAEGTALAAVSDPEAILYNTQYLWNHSAFPVVGFMQKYLMRRSDFGPEELVKPIAGLHLDRQGALILIHSANGDADAGVFTTQIKADLVALVIVGLWFVWWLSMLLMVGAYRLQTHRRRMSGRCIHCAYPLVSQDQKNIQEINIGS